VSYEVKSAFRTLQGEGVHAGRVIVLCRFAGCNLWSGRAEDRVRARCRFCDTDFVGTDGPGGGRFETAEALATHLEECWRHGVDGGGTPFVVFSGGEPLLQLDGGLIAASHQFGFEVAIETNGTLACPAGVDWVCVSPKAGVPLVLRSGDEIKLVHPQPGLDPRSFEDLDFSFLSLQPLDDDDREQHARECVSYCLRHPRWRLSMQMHKQLGIP